MLWFRRNPVPKLRKKYDRIREKVDKIKDNETRLKLLRYLDQIEPTLIALEEQELPPFERRRMINYVSEGILGVEDELKQKEIK